MTLDDKKNKLVAELRALRTAQDRMAYIVRRGRECPPLEDSFRTDEHRLQGCMARLWFIGEFIDGRCVFKVDSDSAIIKGIAVLLCDLHSDCKPAEILGADVGFLEQFGITQHLTPNRRNSLSIIINSIQNFARLHQCT